jgi:hypothetical protein
MQDAHLLSLPQDPPQTCLSASVPCFHCRMNPVRRREQKQTSTKRYIVPFREIPFSLISPPPARACARFNVHIEFFCLRLRPKP